MRIPSRRLIGLFVLIVLVACRAESIHAVQPRPGVTTPSADGSGTPPDGLPGTPSPSRPDRQPVGTPDIPSSRPFDTPSAGLPSGGRDGSAVVGAKSEPIQWAVIIGVNHYLDRNIGGLNFAVQDAKLLFKTLTENCGYQSEHIRLMTDESKEDLRPETANLLVKIPQWLDRAGPDDTVLVFFSGHGVMDSTGRVYLAPRDCRRKDLARSGIRVTEVSNWLSVCSARRKMLVLDCCHAGGKGVLGDELSAEETAYPLRQTRGLLTLGSCERDEESHEWIAKGQGVFTYYLDRGLRGAADLNGNAVIDSDELFEYVHAKVRQYARKTSQEQTPVQIVPPGTNPVINLVRLRPSSLDPDQALSASQKVRFFFRTRIESHAGELLPNATVSLGYRGEPEGPEIKLSRTRTDRRGWCRLSVPSSLIGATGQYVASVDYDGKTKRWLLTGLPGKSRIWNLYVPKRFQEFKNDLGMRFRPIPAGRFMMGSTLSSREVVARYPGRRLEDYQNEHPLHEVSITRAFLLGVHEVTVGDFRRFVEALDYRTTAEEQAKAWGYDEGGSWKELDGLSWRNPGFLQTERDPVTCVSWDDAMAYCRWLSSREDRVYRLPTEAEWEYACRAGTNTVFTWGNNSAAGKGHLNAAGEEGPSPYRGWMYYFRFNDQSRTTTSVGRYLPNEWGMHDMLGNVWEWCSDDYEKDYYASFPTTDPTGPSTGGDRVIRGGGWLSYPRYCRIPIRRGVAPTTRGTHLGFRVVLEVKEPKKPEKPEKPEKPGTP